MKRKNKMIIPLFIILTALLGTQITQSESSENPYLMLSGKRIDLEISPERLLLITGTENLFKVKEILQILEFIGSFYIWNINKYVYFLDLKKYLYLLDKLIKNGNLTNSKLQAFIKQLE